MRWYSVLFLVILFSRVAHADLGGTTPLVPSQIDGLAMDGSTAVMGVLVYAYIDAGSDGVITDESVYTSSISMDAQNNTFDGYFRITIAPEDYSVGVTDVILVATSGGKRGALLISDIGEGTSLGNNLLLTETDLDDDGYGALDCYDLDPAVHPGAIEACNGIDDDCDGSVDEDACVGTDADGDGFAETDCNDAESAIHPGQVEICNGLDDNCDGLTDVGSSLCSAYDFTSSGCDIDDNPYSYDAYSFLSVCVQGVCTVAPDDWMSQLVTSCSLECDGCISADDCSCPPDGCYDGTYKDYSSSCDTCQCSCTPIMPFDSEICDDGLDNDCDSFVDEHCLVQGEECLSSMECGYGLVCDESVCSELESYCSLYMPTNLNQGWNLIGFPSCAEMSVKDGLESIHGKYLDIFVLDAGAWKNYNPMAPVEMNSLTTLRPIQGMYINISEPALLRVINQNI
jgi:hypothetical protein